MTAPRPSSAPPARRAPQVHIWLESRYVKLERGLPQTIFYCPECKGHPRRRKACQRCAGFGKLTKDSVQELIGRVLLPAYRARTGKFHGAGREDIDVRMLGRGRPFVYEVVGARVLEVDLEALDARIHEYCGERIRLEPFRAVPRARVAELKEMKSAKVYRAEVELDAELGADALAAVVGRQLDIVQRTPSRVAHRRADLARERVVTVLGLEPLGARRIAVRARCDHGTYVKEWISGDGDRTAPSLAALLGVGCRCEMLDVVEIDG